jgi:hypothetical protein
MAPQCTADHESPPSSPVRGTLAGAVALMEEDLPSPAKAAWRLARFCEEVVVVREPHLISSPPKQKTPPKRTLPLRSRRIAAQNMDHIPASKRGEVMLKKRLGLLEALAPPSSMSSAPTSPTLRATS